MTKILIDEAVLRQALGALKAGAFGKEKERVIRILEKELNVCKHCNGSGVGYDGMGSRCICQYEQPAPAQPLPPNCGTGYCSCIECLKGGE